MSNGIPHFKYELLHPRKKQCGGIMLNGSVVHRIVSIDEFYAEYGYTLEMAQNGILPEEFIWETYFRHPERNCDACYQLHTIEYLLKHSDSFAQKYGHECNNWIAAHSKARAACNFKCADKELSEVC